MLVVGAGTSGAEIALELAASHPTSLAGRPTPHIPDALFRLAGELYWGFINGVLTLATPIGRKVAAKFHSRGAPLIRISMKRVEAAGVKRLPRITGVRTALPIADGAACPARDGDLGDRYRPASSWIAGLPLDEHGLPVARRGVVASMPGLYFVGMPFQYGLTSQLLGGVGRDAGYVAERIAATRRVARVRRSGKAAPTLARWPFPAMPRAPLTRRVVAVGVWVVVRRVVVCGRHRRLSWWDKPGHVVVIRMPHPSR